MEGLPRSTAADQGVDTAAVLAFVDAVDRDPRTEVHSVMVLRHGHVVAEGWWAPHTPERTRLLYSLSKSFTSTALGFALQEGLLDLEDTVVSHFPEFDADITDARCRSITVRHVSSMASGHHRDMVDEALTTDGREPVRGLLLTPPDGPPGTRFAYSQPCTYALASIIQRRAGMPLSDYLRPRLFDPLGIGEVGWLTWPPGREQGFSGLFARTEDVAKLGQLYLQGGRWGDTQLIPESYVALATARQVATPDEGDVDWRQGYGFQFWRSRHGYRGDGAFGQFCIVLPEQDAVVAITAGTEAMQAVLENLWEHLLPGLGTHRHDEGARPDLDSRLGGLGLAPLDAASGPAGADEWTGAPFPIAPSQAGASAVAVTSIRLTHGEHGVDVTLTERDNSLTMPLGVGDWLVSESRDRYDDPVPVATSGGWLDDQTFALAVLFLESPHRLDVTASLPTRTAHASWRLPPLGRDGIAALHRPRPTGR